MYEQDDPVDGIAPGDTFDDSDGRRQHVVEVRIDAAGHGRCTCTHRGRLYDFHTKGLDSDLYATDHG
jgi:hypothetical protein